MRIKRLSAEMHNIHEGTVISEPITNWLQIHYLINSLITLYECAHNETWSQSLSQSALIQAK